MKRVVEAATSPVTASSDTVLLAKPKPRKKPVAKAVDDVGIRVMNVAESEEAERRWQTSDAKRLLDEQRANLLEKISQKTAGYSKVC